MSSFSQWPDAVLSPQYWGWLLQGWLMTIWATLLVVVCSSVLGIFLAVARSSAQLWLQWLSRLYLSLFRNTPLLVQLFFWYFGLPALLPESVVAWLNTEHVLGLGLAQLAWPSFEFIAAIIGMVFYSTAYVGEEIRAGFNGVSHTQIHAGLALGMKRGQVLRYAHQGGMNPPVVVVHGNSLEGVTDSYKRYLEGRIRQHFNLTGTPLRVEMKTSHNPYA